MKFTINSRVLRSALESANKAVAQKPTIPSLAYFLLEGNGQTLTITGSDSNTTIREYAPCEAEGKALLPTNLLELVRVLNDEDITIETDAVSCKIFWKNGNSQIPAFKPEDYPEIANYDGEYLTIKGESLTSALAKTLPHIAADEMRPIMGGVHFNAKEDGTIDIVATDSHTLALCTVKTENKTAFNFVAPANAVRFIGNAAKANDVEVASDETNIYFRIGSTSIITRKIVGKFPNYKAVIPSSFASTLTAEKGVILDSIQRVLICASKAAGHIKLTLASAQSTIEAQDLSFNVSAKETLEDTNYEGNDLAIGFKGEYLARCIRAIEGSEIKVNFNDANHAAIVTSDDDASIMLVMPVRI